VVPACIGDGARLKSCARADVIERPSSYCFAPSAMFCFRQS